MQRLTLQLSYNPVLPANMCRSNNGRSPQQQQEPQSLSAVKGSMSVDTNGLGQALYSSQRLLALLLHQGQVTGQYSWPLPSIAAAAAAAVQQPPADPTAAATSTAAAGGAGAESTNSSSSSNRATAPPGWGRSSSNSDGSSSNSDGSSNNSDGSSSNSDGSSSSSDGSSSNSDGSSSSSEGSSSHGPGSGFSSDAMQFSASLDLPVPTRPMVMQLVLVHCYQTTDAAAAGGASATATAASVDNDVQFTDVADVVSTGSNSNSSTTAACSSNISSSALQLRLPSLRPVSRAFACLPLLLLPLPAQQEVQQLLLPAMREEVSQIQLLQQQQHQQEEEQLEQHFEVEGGKPLTDVLLWPHWCELAGDMAELMQAFGLPPVPPAAAGGAASEAEVEVNHQQEQQQQQRQQYVLQHVVPLVLPYLSGLGLHHCLQLMLGCLPQEAQQWWDQEQQHRIRLLAELEEAEQATAAAVVGEEQQQQQQEQRAREEGEGVGVNAIESCNPEAAGFRGTVPEAGAAAAAGSAAASAAEPSSPVKPHKGSVLAQPLSPSASKSQQKKDKQQQYGLPHHQQQELQQQQQAPSIPWWLPLSYFPASLEQEYVQYKHNKNLLFDYYTATFGMLYCLALVGRMVWERSVMGTAMYLLYIIFKAGVYVPLVLGHKEWFLR